MQRRKGKIHPAECKVPEDSKEREESLGELNESILNKKSSFPQRLSTLTVVFSYKDHFSANAQSCSNNFRGGTLTICN